MNKSMPGKTFTGNIPFALLMVALLAGSLYSAPAALSTMGWDLLPEILKRIVPPAFLDRDFNVIDYDSVGDGITDCNPAFQKAIVL
jgi:polygalacturonase